MSEDQDRIQPDATDEMLKSEGVEAAMQRIEHGEIRVADARLIGLSMMKQLRKIAAARRCVADSQPQNEPASAHGRGRDSAE